MTRSVPILSLLLLGTPATCTAAVVAQEFSLIDDNVGYASIAIINLIETRTESIARFPTTESSSLECVLKQASPKGGGNEKNDL